MHIIHHAQMPSTGGSAGNATVVAGRILGLQAFEVVLLTMVPGAVTPAQVHSGELVVLVRDGTGRLLIDGGQQRFAGHCTLLIPAGEPFEIGNCGASVLQTVWVYTHKPTPFDGHVETPD